MFKEERFTLLRHHGFMWPPELSDGMMLDHYQICLHGLTVRQAELIVFCHTKWPPGDSKMDFLDASPTLAFLVRYKNENADQVYNPWHSAPKTLVGSSCIAVRMKADDGNFIRPLFVWEYFSLVGWAPSMWKVGTTEMPSRALCANLCGNAFSAFAIGPLISSALSITGSIQALPHYSTTGGAEVVTSSEGADRVLSSSEGEDDHLEC